MTSPAPSPSDFPLTTFDKLRYADTDRQGHVNNAVFTTALETGRVELLYAPDARLADPGCAFVIASLHLDFLAELSWPGTVEVGTRVAAVGRSSLTLDQGLFQAGRCVATARTVIVQMNERSRRAQPLGGTALRRLGELRGAGPDAGTP